MNCDNATKETYLGLENKNNLQIRPRGCRKEASYLSAIGLALGRVGQAPRRRLWGGIAWTWTTKPLVPQGIP